MTAKEVQNQNTAQTLKSRPQKKKKTRNKVAKKRKTRALVEDEVGPDKTKDPQASDAPKTPKMVPKRGKYEGVLLTQRKIMELRALGTAFPVLSTSAAAKPKLERFIAGRLWDQVGF